MFIYMHVHDKVVTENELFEKMKVEAEKCLTQTERIANERLEFESEIYAKVTSQLGDKHNSKGSFPEGDPFPLIYTDKTESFDEENDFERSDEDPQKDITSSSKEVMANKPSHSKRTRHK
uniref:Uncharacterized protein n=1 Tax=Glycine max TaxID=3847 RepID=A0A0R0JPE3_SOYBN